MPVPSRQTLEGLKLGQQSQKCKAQRITRPLMSTYNSTTLCSERRAPQKMTWVYALLMI